MTWAVVCILQTNLMDPRWKLVATASASAGQAATNVALHSAVTVLVTNRLTEVAATATVAAAIAGTA